MSQLKLYGMKAAYDEIITTAVKRQHEPQQIVGDLLNAEIDQVTSWLATEILALSEFLTSYWEEIDDAMFEHLWQTEVDAVPEFTTSKITLICGLLLPIWDRLPAVSPRWSSSPTGKATARPPLSSATTRCSRPCPKG